jgi:hypothetical protein
MKRITWLLPKKTRVTLGGRIFLVGEIRLSDLWELQTWLDERWECPLDSLRGSLSDLQEFQRRKTLRGIWDATQEGPAVWGSARARKLFHTGEGIIEQFRVVLREHQPELCTMGEPGRYPDLEELAQAVSDQEDGFSQFHRMMMAWQPIDPLEELASMLGELPESSGEPVTWVQAVMEVCEVYHWTIEYAMGLTMRQFRAARSGGKVSEFGDKVAPKSNLKAIVAAKKKQLAKEAGLSVYKGAGSDGH